MSFLTKLLFSKPSNCQLSWSILHRRAESTKSQVEQVMVTELSEDGEETEEEREAKIEKMRNKSRLNAPHRNMVHGRLPYPESQAFYHDSVQYKRREWARYEEGQTKVCAGIAWPDKEELEDRKEYEQVQCPLSIQEMVANEREKIDNQDNQIKKRYNSIVENLKKNDTFIQLFHEKQIKKSREAMETKQQKEKVFNEIRKHFGFNIDPNDEQFQEMLEIKKKEEAKKRRIEKKKQREETMIKMAMEMEKEMKTSTESGDSKPAEKKDTKVEVTNAKKEE